ncbi:MAG: phosphoribosylformylglycinamidine cyclo-ligase [Alphaproteobacteria bacterium]
MIKITYKSSGVNTKNASKLVNKLEKITKKNFRPEIIQNPGGFCSLFDLKKLRYRDPILLSSTDGVGTKLKVALEFDKLNYLGIDLVAMCVNDILANGGEPLFFLDYFSSSKLNNSNFLKIMKSINTGCIQAGCSLIGGETAEMPGIYAKNDFDLAGFSVGVVERENLINKNNVRNGDIIIGLKSSGFHSNGYSLIRNVINKKKINLESNIPYKKNGKVGDELIIPTKIYVKELLPLIQNKLINSIAHVTGGGISENLSRAIPTNLTAIIDAKDFKIPKLFLWLKELANISIKEMLNTFNCGIGMIIIIKNKNEKEVCGFLNKSKVNYSIIGEIKRENPGDKKILFKKFDKWNLI